MKKYFITILIIGGIITILSVPKTYTIENIRPEPEAKIEKSEDRIITAKITQYTLKGIMASGLEVYNGSIACPRSIPLKTRVEIDGIEYICEDRLSVRYDNRFDIWQQDLFSAIQWGIREKEVIIK